MSSNITKFGIVLTLTTLIAPLVNAQLPSEEHPRTRVIGTRATPPGDMTRMREIKDVDPDLPLPKRALFVKVSLSGSASGPDGTPGPLDISYKEIADYMLGTQTIDAVVDKAMDDDKFLNWRPAEATTGKYPPPSRLSLQNKENTYIVFMIKCGNCRFATSDYPFRIETDKARHHVAPRVVWRTANNKPKHAHKADPDVQSTIGYFIAYSKNDMGIASDFRSNFNFYLELTFPNQKPVPISIDPDVGYPGGYVPKP